MGVAGQRGTRQAVSARPWAGAGKEAAMTAHQFLFGKCLAGRNGPQRDWEASKLSIKLCHEGAGRGRNSSQRGALSAHSTLWAEGLCRDQRF